MRPRTDRQLRIRSVLGAAMLVAIVGCASTPSSDDFLGFFDESTPREPASTTELKLSTVGEIEHWALNEGVLTSREHRCRIGEEIRQAWTATHPQDSYHAYFVQNGSLYGMKRTAREPKLADDASPERRCVGVEAQLLLSDLKKTGRRWWFQPIVYGNADFVAVALAKDGTFVAWDRERAAFKRHGIEAYRVNPCYLTKRRAHNPTLALLLNDRGGAVVHLIGRKDRGGQIQVAQENEGYYADLLQYVERKRICAYEG